MENHLTDPQSLLYGDGRQLSRGRADQTKRLRQLRSNELLAKKRSELEEVIRDGARAASTDIDSYRELFADDGLERKKAALDESARAMVRAENDFHRISLIREIILPALLVAFIQSIMFRSIGAWSIAVVPVIIGAFVVWSLRRNSERSTRLRETRAAFEDASNAYRKFCSDQINFDPEELRRRDRVRDLLGDIKRLSASRPVEDKP